MLLNSNNFALCTFSCKTENFLTLSETFLPHSTFHLNCLRSSAGNKSEGVKTVGKIDVHNVRITETRPWPTKSANIYDVVEPFALYPNLLHKGSIYYYYRLSHYNRSQQKCKFLTESCKIFYKRHNTGHLCSCRTRVL